MRALSFVTSARRSPRAPAAAKPASTPALVEPDRVHHALDHAVEIGVVEHDERTFPPSSSESFLARSRRGLANDAAHLGRAV